MSQIPKQRASSLPPSGNSGPAAAKLSVTRRLAALIMRARCIVQFAALGAFLLVCHTANADVTVEHQDQLRLPTFLLISGTITKADVPVVSNALSRQKASVPEVMVFLDSGGGDVDAAMEIGRLIRNRVSVAGTADKMQFVLGATVNSPLHPRVATYCASACVLILCAAKERLGGPRIGIHRPYSVRQGPSDQDWMRSAAYASVATKLKDYLQEMAMPAGLFEEMMRVPADGVRWLSGAEQAAFRLSGQGAAATASPPTQVVAQLGAATREFLDRKAHAARACPGRPDFLNCMN